MSDPTPAPRRKIAGERRLRRPPEPDTEPAAEPAEALEATGPGTEQPSGALPPPPRPPASRRLPGAQSFARVPNWLLIGLALLLSAAVVFDVVVGIRSQTQAQERTTSSAAITSALRQAPVQAETAAVRALAFDYKTLQDDADEAKRFMTTQYAATFQKTVDGLLVAPANQRKAHVEADVKAAGVVSASAAKVEVMLFVDQTSTTTLQSQPQTYLNRVLFTMVKSGDRWLVDGVTAL